MVDSQKLDGIFFSIKLWDFFGNLHAIKKSVNFVFALGSNGLLNSWFEYRAMLSYIL